MFINGTFRLIRVEDATLQVVKGGEKSEIKGRVFHESSFVSQ